MANRRFRPPLKKRRLGTCEDYIVYAVDDFAVRNVSQAEEEFAGFATYDDFPDLIGKREVWVSRHLARREARFFAPNAVEQIRAERRGRSEDEAYDDGLRVERALRAQATGVPYRGANRRGPVPPGIRLRRYALLPTEGRAIPVWLVDGFWVRCRLDTDFTEGGHGVVYPYVPVGEIWIERALNPAEVPLIVAHEYVEMRLMREEGTDYDRAHRIAAHVEFDLRRADRRRMFPGLSRRSLGRADFPAMTSPSFFAHVHAHYV